MRKIVFLLGPAFLLLSLAPAGSWGGTNAQPATGPPGLAGQAIRSTRCAESLKVSEHTKARALCERMAYVRGQRGGENVPEEVRRKTQDLDDKLAAAKAAQWRAYEKGHREAIPKLERIVKSVTDELEIQVHFLRENYPRYAALRYPGPLDISQVFLGDTEWAIVYEITDSGILVYLIKGRNLLGCFFKTISRPELDELVRRFVTWDVTSPGSIREAPGSFDPKVGKQLADLLLRDVLPKLPKSAPLIIVPDESLQRLPFEMLVLNEGGSVAKGQGIPEVSGVDFFGDHHPIAYCPSLSWLTNQRILRHEQKTGDRILVVADPVFSPRDPRMERAPDFPSEDRPRHVPLELISTEDRTAPLLPRLILTGELASFISRLHPGRTDVLTGLEASKKRFLQEPLDQYDTIVIATHGFAASDLPGVREPVLVLSTVNLPSVTDGLLRAGEVMELQINADLVILLSDATGLGKAVAGEGMMSMGRAALYAGGSTVLVSLWPVVESSAVKLAQSFFKHMAAGHGKPQALKLAKEDLRNDGFDHPFFWAAFVLVGEVN